MTLRRAAALDIGSNTTLFLLGDVDDAGKISVLTEAQVSNGIGEDVFLEGRLQPSTIERNLQIVENFWRLSRQQGCQNFLIAGTSALRQAANAGELISAVMKLTGCQLRIISGEDEARLTFKGYLSGKSAIAGKIILVDIGGGSSEIILADHKTMESSASLEIGAVRLHRLFPLFDPPNPLQIEKMSRFVDNFLRKLYPYKNIGERKVVFSGGTATCLATLKLGLLQYIAAEVDGLILSDSEIERFLQIFCNQDLKTRKKLLHFDPERAPVIIGGSVLMLKIMNFCASRECRVSHLGLRFGLLAELFEK